MIVMMRFTFHKKPISSAVYNALMSLCVDILQNGKLCFFDAFSSSCASPITTYVLLRPNLVMIRSKHDSLPKCFWRRKKIFVSQIFESGGFCYNFRVSYANLVIQLWNLKIIRYHIVDVIGPFRVPEMQLS